MARSGFAWSVLLVLAAPVASADWLGVGHDAEGTGQADGAGPSWDDIAFVAKLPGWGPWRASEMVVVDGAIYVMSWYLDSGDVAGQSVVYRLFRLSLDDGQLENFSLPSPPRVYHPAELASDGTKVYALIGSYVYTFDPSVEKFSEPLGLGPANLQEAAAADAGNCCERSSRMVWSEGKLYIAKTGRYFGQMHPLWLYVVDPESGIVTGPITESAKPQGDLSGYQSGAPPSAYSGVLEINGLAVSKGIAVVTTSFVADNAANGAIPSLLSRSTAAAFTLMHVWGVDTSTRSDWVLDYTWDPGARAAPAIIVGDRVFVKAPHIQIRELATGKAVTVLSLRSDPEDRGNGMLWMGDHLIVTAGRYLYSYDADLKPAWAAPATAQGLVFQPMGLFDSSCDSGCSHGTLAATDDTILALATAGPGTPSVVLAFDASNGALRWRHTLGAAAEIVADDGLAITLDGSGLLAVLGDVPASLHPTFRASTRYPAPSERVEVTFESSTPGLGPATEFRADWGDGTTTEWTSTPTLAHVYSTAVESQARVYARNAAGQTASVPLTFHVGQHDPTISILNSPLRAEYQQTTYFLLGLIVTALVAAIGIYRAGRKRRQMHRELAALEGDHKRLVGDVIGCEQMLSERRARVRGLFLEKRIEEAHLAFLLARIDELRQTQRLSAIEQRLDYLPLGMVKTLREMLRDARITEYELDHFLRALDADTILDPSQKAQVRDLIEGWFDRDAAAPSGGRASDVAGVSA